MWFTNPDGLWRLDGGGWRQYRQSDGLLTHDPYILDIGPDGAIWLHDRYDAGIERLEFSGGRLVRATAILPADPSSVEVTAFHGFDAFGHLWRGSANGVSILQNGAWRQMSEEDGLIWNDTDGEAFWPDADGSVWIGASGGLAHYTPPASGIPPVPLADPVITRLDVDPKSRLVRAEFSCLKFKTEQLVRFAYRLDSDRWHDATERALSLAGLGPGLHRLEIQARVRDGPFSPRIAVAEFTFPPKWWETWWLRAAALALAIASVSAALLTRSRRTLRQRTAEFESERTRMLEEKRSADAEIEAKARFLATMSHEIRTPLNGVIGLTTELEAMAVPPEAREIVQMIHSSTDALFRVISDVLDFSKAEAGKLEIEVAPFDLRRTLQESVRLFRAPAAEKGLRLVCELSPDLPEWVAGDAARLRQVLLNLIANAVKFTGAGEVVLSASSGPQEDAGYVLLLSVRDTGIGIAPDQIPLLFSSFHQADASISRRYGGTGLGLAISKRLLELMGGSIAVESTPGVGTCFRFTVRVGAAQPHAAAQDEIPSHIAAAHLRVLVAEDNVVNQRVLLKFLEKFGIHADLAADGAQAIAAALAKPFDLVLMDVQMPGVDGLSATREIRRRLPADRQPIIFGVTAHATGEYHDICLAAGMNGYLTKPLNRARLAGLIEELAARPLLGQVPHSSPHPQPV